MKRFPAKQKVDKNPFARNQQKWFLERIECFIIAKHPAGDETEIKIESKHHAFILYKTRQLKDGYFFSDKQKRQYDITRYA